MGVTDSSLKQRQRWMRERQTGGLSEEDVRDAVFVFEPHYTIADLAEHWSLSPDAIRRLFEDEPGVLVLGDKSRPGKRRYTTLRIPKSVAERVYRRHQRL